MPPIIVLSRFAEAHLVATYINEGLVTGVILRELPFRPVGVDPADIPEVGHVKVVVKNG